MRPSRIVPLVSIAGAISILVAGCSSRSPTSPRSLVLGLDRTRVTVAPGSSSRVTVTVERIGFDGAVTVSLLGLPSSVHADPTDVPAGKDSGSVTLVADSAAEPASMEVTIQAVTAGGTTTTAPLALVVGRDGSSAFSFAFGADSARIAPDVPDSLHLVITRAAGFTGAVSFEAVGMPAGMTALFRPDTVVGDTTRLGVTADASVRMDSTFALTLTGFAAGVGVVSRTLYTTVSTSRPDGFLLQPAYDSVVMYPGETDSIDLTVRRTGSYTAAVSLRFTGTPLGLAASVSPARATGDSALITIYAKGPLALDSTYYFELNGTGQGVPPVTDTMAVTVRARQASSVAPTLGPIFRDLGIGRARVPRAPVPSTHRDRATSFP